MKSAQSSAMLYIFEDNEAVIKMIIKGRSPTMSALHWSFDRINLDPKIQIKDVDTKNQLEDTLTKGNFTRDEWNNLLHLFNISHFSSASCPEAMSSENCGKVEADVEPGVAFCGKLSYSAEFECIVLRLLEEYRGTCSERTKSRRHSVEFSNVAKRCREGQEYEERLEAEEKDQKLLNFHENLTSTRELEAFGNSDIDGNDTKWPHILHISTAYVSHLEKVLSNVRHGRSKPGD